MTMTAERIDIDKVKPIDASKIDPQANYRCRIQVGARHAWRSYKGGKVETKKNEQDGSIEIRHIPAVHITAPLKGETVIGLAEDHNSWLESNRIKAMPSGTNSSIRRTKTLVPVQASDGRPVYKGDVARQLLITDFEETTDPSEDRRVFLNPFDQMRNMIAEGLKDALEAIFAAADSIKTPGKAKA